MALHQGVDLAKEEERLAHSLDAKARVDYVQHVQQATAAHHVATEASPAVPHPASALPHGVLHLRTKEEEEALAKADHERVKAGLQSKYWGDDERAEEERKRKEAERKAKEASDLASKLAAKGLAPR